MTWEHRIVRVNGTLQFAEVFYDEVGNPSGYSDPFVISETMDGLRELAGRLAEACLRPIVTFPDDVT